MSQTITKLHFTRTRPTMQARLSHLSHAIAMAWQAASTRHQLGQLDDRALSDIGISRAQAEFNVERPVWDLVPGNCR